MNATQRGFKGTTAGPFRVRVYDDRIEVRRWHLVNGEPGTLIDGFACSRTDAQGLLEALIRLMPVEASSS